MRTGSRLRGPFRVGTQAANVYFFPLNPLLVSSKVLPNNNWSDDFTVEPTGVPKTIIFLMFDFFTFIILYFHRYKYNVINKNTITNIPLTVRHIK